MKGLTFLRWITAAVLTGIAVQGYADERAHSSLSYGRVDVGGSARTERAVIVPDGFRFQSYSVSESAHSDARPVGSGAAERGRAEADIALGRFYLESRQFTPLPASWRMSSLDSAHVMAAGDVAYGHSFGTWRVSGHAGALWLRADYTESANERESTPLSVLRLGRAKVGAEVARMFGPVEPFVSATYNYSFSDSGPASRAFTTDRTELQFGLGARYLGEDALSGALELTTRVGTEQPDDHSINVLIRADF